MSNVPNRIGAYIFSIFAEQLTPKQAREAAVQLIDPRNVPSDFTPDDVLLLGSIGRLVVALSDREARRRRPEGRDDIDDYERLKRLARAVVVKAVRDRVAPAKAPDCTWRLWDGGYPAELFALADELGVEQRLGSRSFAEHRSDRGGST